MNALLNKLQKTECELKKTDSHLEQAGFALKAHSAKSNLPIKNIGRRMKHTPS